MSLTEQAKPEQTTHGAPPQPNDGGVTASPARPGKLLRLPAVEELTGAKESRLYNWVKAGTFPAPVRLAGARAVAWRESDIAQWIAERPTATMQVQSFLANHGEAKLTDLHQAAVARRSRIAERIKAGGGTK